MLSSRTVLWINVVCERARAHAFFIVGTNGRYINWKVAFGELCK